MVAFGQFINTCTLPLTDSHKYIPATMPNIEMDQKAGNQRISMTCMFPIDSDLEAARASILLFDEEWTNNAGHHSGFMANLG
jgi:hypothetical protein